MGDRQYQISRDTIAWHKSYKYQHGSLIEKSHCAQRENRNWQTQLCNYAVKCMLDPYSTILDSLTTAIINQTYAGHSTKKKKISIISKIRNNSAFIPGLNKDLLRCKGKYHYNKWKEGWKILKQSRCKQYIKRKV